MSPNRRTAASIVLTAALVLGGCGHAPPAAEPVGARAVPALAAGLKAKDPSARARAAMSLGRMGPEAREAVPELIAALKDREPSVRAAAAQALGAVGPDAAPARPALEALAKQPLTRQVASEALERIGP